MADEIQVTPPSRRLELAYLAVFGDPSKRTKAQELVRLDLEEKCHAYRVLSKSLEGGELSTTHCHFNDGARSVWLHIRATVNRALAEPVSLKSSRQKKN